jgi:acyl dehydratase
MPLLYLDDLHVGQSFTSVSRTLDRECMVRFAQEWDPQPFHLDETAAQGSFFAGLAGSGWFTAAVTMRLLVDGGLPLACGIIGTGGELLWTKPTRPGDTLHVETEILEIAPSRSKPDRGMVLVRCVTLNQNGKTVQSFTPKLVVFRRPGSSGNAV